MKRIALTAACLMVVAPLLFPVGNSRAGPKRQPAATSRIPGQSDNVDLVGQLGGVTNDVAVQGEYAYIGLGPRLAVLDITEL